MAAVAVRRGSDTISQGARIQISWEPRDDPKDPADDAKSDEAPD